MHINQRSSHLAWAEALTDQGQYCLNNAHTAYQNVKST